MSNDTTTTASWSDGLPESSWVKITPGDRVQLKVIDREIRPSSLRKRADGTPADEIVATVEVDGEVKSWTPNAGALRALESARVANGDVIRVERGADTMSNGFTVSNWTVEKIERGDNDFPF
jgi:hypothetical protein